jgi:hypothetical protein
MGPSSSATSSRADQPRQAAGTVRKRLLAAVVACLAWGANHSAQAQPAIADPVCPTIVQPIPTSTAPTVSAPIFPALVAALFYNSYNAWNQRIEQPDIALRSDADIAWKQVREFIPLTALGKPYIPYVMAEMRAGDFRLVPAIECITGVHSEYLYPSPLPPAGEFGLQDVAALWVANGAQVVEDICKTRCGNVVACQDNCTADRQQYWGP